MLFNAALEHPNSIALYIALTRVSAKNIMWPILTEMNTKYDLRAEMAESSLEIKLPNASRIMLVGADMKNFIERLRGPKYSIAIIDEAGSFRSHLQSLIDDILKPALLDYNGALVLLGTPGVMPLGTFYDCTTKDIGYSVHRWSLYDNPYLPNAREYVSQLIRKRQWTELNPTYRREYLGEWVVDLDALVYRFRRERNVYKELPANQTWNRVLAVDFGWHDQTAFAVISYSHTNRRAFLEYSTGYSELIPSDIARKLEQIRERYDPVCVVADTGGLGKSITEEFIRRYSIPIIAAEKRDKLTHISLMNGDFIDGNLMVHESCSELMDQYETLTKGDDGMEDPGMKNDLCDAALYAYWRARHYLGEIPEDIPKEGSLAHGVYLEKKMLEKEIEEFEKQEKMNWWEA